MAGEGEDPERAVGEQQQQDLVLGLGVGVGVGLGLGFGLGVGVGFEQQQQDLAAERGGGDGSCWVGGVVVDAPTEGDPL